MSSEIILHSRRLRLSPRQARWLSTLLARPGRLVSESDLQYDVLSGSRTSLTRAISRIREVIRPHGYTIYRVVGYGFVLVEEEEERREQ